jgi:hypothetical protein
VRVYKRITLSRNLELSKITQNQLKNKYNYKILISRKICNKVIN